MRWRLMPAPFLGVSWSAAAAAAGGGTGGCPAYGTCRAHPTAPRTVAPTKGLLILLVRVSAGRSCVE